MGRIPAVLLTVVLLIGCGGEDKSSQSPATMPETGSDTGVVLNERAALSISNSYLRVQAVPGLPPVESTLETDCEGQTCTLTESNSGISESVSLQDIQNTETSDIENLRQVVDSLTRNGVAVYGGGVTFALGEDSTVSATAYGGWMAHNYFLAAWGNYSDPNIPSAQVGTGLSIGNATGTHPALDATYNGVMLGVITEEGGAQGDGVEGDATLDFSMANPGGARMDVSFTDITNRDTGGPLPAIEWSGIQVGDDGTFETGDIHGLFYGPNHEEVGGTFNKDDVAGAFGAVVIDP